MRITLPLTNRRLFDTFEARCALAIEFRRYRPKLVIGLGEKTPLASPDHWQAMQITDAAVFYARLTKWDEHFAGLPVHRIEAQLYYTLAFYALEPMRGSHIVCDISDTLDKKLAAIRCYATQFPAEKQHVFDRVERLGAAPRRSRRLRRRRAARSARARSARATSWAPSSATSSSRRRPRRAA